MSVKPKVQEMATKIKEVLVLEGSSISEKEDSNIYEDTLPEGLDLETVAAVNDHNTTFIAGSALAIGEMAVEALSNNTDTDRIEGKVKMASADSIKINVDRSKEFTNHLTDGKKSTKYGVVSSNYEVRAGKNSGQLKAARLAISELATKALK